MTAYGGVLATPNGYMLHILAQAASEDAGVYEAVRQGVEAGIKDTAVSRPSEWLMVLLSLVISYFFLRHQRTQTESFSNTVKDLNAAVDIKKNQVADAVALMNATILTIQSKFAEDAIVARKECHANSLSLKEGQGVLHEIAHDIKDAVVSIREETASQERIADSTRSSLHALRNVIQQIKVISEVAEARHNREQHGETALVETPATVKDKDNAS